MTVGKKLSISFGGLLALTLILSVVSLFVIRNLSAELDTMASSTNRAVAEIGHLTTSLAGMQAAEVEFILFFSIGDTERVETARGNFQKAAKEIESMFDVLGTLLPDSQSRSALATLKQGHADLSRQFQQMDRACQESRCNEALEMHTKQTTQLAAQINEAAARLTKLQEASSAKAASDAGNTAHLSQWAMISLVLVAVGLGVVVFFVLRDILRRLADFASQIGAASGHVAEAANRVTSTSQQLARGASEQAASIEQTSATTEEIASMTRKNAENTSVAVRLVEESDRNVIEANRRLQQMMSSMEAINDSSTKISRINKAIDEIAFQTNILALNAAVEAARAGNAGLGFAVVADEVRSLAQRSLQASKDTAALIDESIARAGEGKLKLEEVKAAIDQITDSSSKVRVLIEEVSTGSHEQAQGIEQVTRTVSHMNGVTQRSASSADETAAAGAELISSAEEMRELGTELELMIHGS